MKFPKISRGQSEDFFRAREYYEKGAYSDCYRLIAGLAAQNVPRAIYCKALLDLNGNVAEAEGEEAFLDGLKRAAALKYPLAYGLLAKYYFETDKTAELAELCLRNKKVAEVRLSSLLAATYDGFYPEAVKFENAKLARKTYAATEKLFAKELKGLEKGSPEWEENDLYVSFGAGLKQSYAFFNRLLMISYRYANVYADREAYREAYRRAVAYSDSAIFLFGVHRVNAETLMNDSMGLSDLKAVNESMKKMNEAYERLDAGTRELNAESYEEIWERYREYYEAESARLASLHIQTTENFGELYKGKGVGEWVSDLAKGVERWANTPQPQTRTVYTVNGKQYYTDEYGVLTEENGIKSDYRIDDVGRLYDEKTGRRLGYFSTDGIFMPE